MDNQDFEQVVNISLNTQPEREDQFADKDPFAKSWDDLKELTGLETNFKRRTSQIGRSSCR